MPRQTKAIERLKKPEQRLLRHFRSLPPEQQQALSDYAEWLASRYRDAAKQKVPAQPLDIPRPAEESVVKAIKRLTATYPMLDTSKMLTRTSTFMTRHLIEGQSSQAIIDEMEDYFRECYERQVGDADGA